MKSTHINWIGFTILYKKEMARTFRVAGQTLLSPVLTTALYFIVFGSAIGSRIETVGDVTYAQYIVPGLIMMSLLTNALTAASSGIYFPKFIGTKYELLSAPLSYLEITLSMTLAAASRAMIISVIIYAVSLLFTPVPVAHPFLAISFAFLTAFSFSLFGMMIGIWADSFEKLSVFPALIITPLSFLGGVFYSIEMLPEFWQKVSLLNPIVYMIGGLRWSFFQVSDIDPLVSFGMIIVWTIFCLGTLSWMFRTGYKIKS